MQVFKFGGASVRDAAAVKNVAGIVNNHAEKPCLIVISAMGKTTNALEELTKAIYQQDHGAKGLLKEIRDRHIKIATKLFEKSNHQVFKDLDTIFTFLENLSTKKPETDFDYLYDQIVSCGEVLSTKIISHYLNEQKIKNHWLDVREIIKTSDEHRDPKILWELTGENVNKVVKPLLKKEGLIITQGFLGSTKKGKTTTLGREGSDYTAAIFANLLDAERQVVWKDVPGILNADPNQFPDAQKIDKLSYYDAIEMTFYGATVIHPKTIKPLQNKGIPLIVRSFILPDEDGTVIIKDLPKEEKVPIIIYKKNQAIVRISTRDFSFMWEDNLSHIYKAFDKLRVSISMTENAAISLSICMEDKAGRVEKLAEMLEDRFDISILKNVEVLTVKNFTDELVKKLTGHRIIRFTQIRNDMARFILQ